MQSVEVKKIKDPVYGYISIPTEYIKRIIDTAEFQRLRRVLQTSYAPLYSSALHNRFVHSIGVLYLGSIAAEQLEEVVIRKNIVEKDIIKKYVQVYKMACLLHDVGHAPFSHTGEIYYKNQDFKAAELHDRLCELVPSEEFEKDLPGESQSAAPHEIMSAIVGISRFGDIIGDDENRELFARCITGYKYDDSTTEKQIKNCFIIMLNSKVIDVDRLDYLIRDAYTSGFATISIDYIRLLKALNIVKEDGKYVLAYQKDAVSVIENVVYAHDAERKWIQNHPVVVYEAYLLKHILEHLNEEMNIEGYKLFSEESLSKEGNKLKNDLKVSLLCDDDVIYLAKNVFPDNLGEEFFERNKRRHPVWKSEAEYNAYIRGKSRQGEHNDLFTECMNSFNESKIPDHHIPMIINDQLIEKFEKEFKDMESSGAERKQLQAIKRKLDVCYYLKEYVVKNDLPFDFIIMQTSMFNSNFSKKHLGDVLISFGKDDKTKVKKLKDVCNILSSEKVDSDDKDFYYLFYRRKEPTENNSGKIDDIESFCRKLYLTVLNSEIE